MFVWYKLKMTAFINNCKRKQSQKSTQTTALALVTDLRTIRISKMYNSIQ